MVRISKISIPFPPVSKIPKFSVVTYWDEANTYSACEAREKVRDQVTIGFGFSGASFSSQSRSV